MDWVVNQADVYKGPIGSLYHHCQKCSAPGTRLLRCGACLAVRYCSREHQVAHRPRHKGVCSEFKKMRADLAKEEHRVRNAKEDMWTPANAFETDVGRFWGLVGTRDYMRARMELAENLRQMGTLDSVQEALDHMLDMLRLCRSDNMGVRDVVPATLLRLDRDQECYDFVKWWANNRDGSGNWSETRHTVCGIDVLEPPDFEFTLPSSNHHVATLLVKLRLLVDIRNLKVTRKIRATRQLLPAEVWDMIELSVIQSPLSIGLQKQSPEALRKTETTLIDHIRKLGTSLARSHPDFMSILFDPDDALSSTPSTYAMGSWEESAITMQYAYCVWNGTEGLLDLVNDARAYAGGDLGNGSTVWEHIKEAADNAAYLGPRTDVRPKRRPQKRKARKN